MQDIESCDFKSRKVYSIIIFLGAACVIPWTAVTTASDYFNAVFEGQRIEFWFAVWNFLPLMVGVAVMTKWGKNWDLRQRLRLSLGVVFFSMLLLILAPVLVGNAFLKQRGGFDLAQLALALSSTGVAVFQASLFGLASMLGGDYIQAIQFGMGWCEVIVSAVRFMTKPTFSIEESGMIFLVLAALVVVAAFLLLLQLEKLSMVKQLLEQSASKFVGGTVVSELGGKHGGYATIAPVEECEKKHSSIMVIFCKTWQPLTVAFFVFVTCLSFFPGVVTSFQSRYWHLTSWFPVLLVSSYCTGDLLGKGLPVFVNIFQPPKHSWLWLGLLVHLCFFPLFLAGMGAPSNPIFSSEPYYCFLCLMLGFSTGYLGVASTMIVPSLVQDHEKETAGMFCPFFVISGLLMGSIVGIYFFS